MIPADSKNIQSEYEVLLNELKKYNPELADKQRVLAISKCDMLDEEMMEQMKNELPDDVQCVFISSVSGLGIDALKDILWVELNKETNKVVEWIHRPMELTSMEEDEDLDEVEDGDDDDEDDDDLSKYKGIGWDEQ